METISITSTDAQRLLTIAKWQHRYLWSMLGFLVGRVLVGGATAAIGYMPGTSVYDNSLSAFSVVAGASMAFVYYKWQTPIRAWAWWIWALVLMAIVPLPGVALILLAVTSSKSNALFRSFGLEVGFMGLKKEGEECLIAIAPSA